MAFEDLGVYAPGFEVPEAGEVAQASNRLNLMIKAWQAAGVGLWLNLLCTLPMKAGAQSYLLGPTGDHCSSSMYDTAVAMAASAGDTAIAVDSVDGMVAGQNIGIQLDDETIQWTTVAGAPAVGAVPLAAALTDTAAIGNVVFYYANKISRPIGVVEARKVDTNEGELVLSAMSRLEYMQLPLKSSIGPTVQYYFDPQLGNAVLYVWPVNNVMSDRIQMTIRTPVQDFVNPADTPDFPIEWCDALHYNLAMRLLPAYQVPPQRSAEIKELALITLRDANDFDREQNVAVQFVPHPEWIR